MPSPTLSQLPPPPPGRTGWPWTEESPRLPDTMPDGSPWPRVSIVTPSYNQGQFIEETIRSVLLQGYPNLEYIIIDGGSRDGTIDVIRKYEPWLEHWVSEPDSGQSNAINKGFRFSTGDILAWLNSDDYYEPQALRRAGEFLHGHPRVGLAYGDCRTVNRADGTCSTWRAQPVDTTLIVLGKTGIPQPTAFWRREVADAVGPLDESLNYVMDLDYWIRISQRFSLGCIGQTIANFSMHESSKTVAHAPSFFDERLGVLDRLFAQDSLADDVLNCRHKAYSNVYHGLGEQYLIAGEKAKARSCFWRGIKTSPWRIATVVGLGYLLDASTGSRLGPWLMRACAKAFSTFRAHLPARGAHAES